MKLPARPESASRRRRRVSNPTLITDLLFSLFASFFWRFCTFYSSYPWISQHLKAVSPKHRFRLRRKFFGREDSESVFTIRPIHHIRAACGAERGLSVQLLRPRSVPVGSLSGPLSFCSHKHSQPPRGRGERRRPGFSATVCCPCLTTCTTRPSSSGFYPPLRYGPSFRGILVVGTPVVL